MARENEVLIVFSCINFLHQEKEKNVELAIRSKNHMRGRRRGREKITVE